MHLPAVFTGPMLSCMAYSYNHLNLKEEKMLNRKMVILVLVAVFVGLVCVINVNASEAEKVNINTASAEQLTQLKGIGPNHAAKIIAFREQNGPFKAPEDLMQVSGIGQKTFENNKELILVAEPE
jgi:competence protein ComEA